MTVTKRQWIDKQGLLHTAYGIHVQERGKDGRLVTVRESREGIKQDAAKKWERDVRGSILDGTWQKTRGRDAVPTLEDWMPRLYEACVEDGKESTAELYELTYRCHLKELLGEYRLHEIRPTQIADLKKALKAKGLKFKTRNNILGVLSRALNLAVELEVLDNVPRVKKFRKKKETEQTEKAPRFLSFEEREQLARVAETTEPEWFPFTEFMPDTGLRVSEALALRPEDVRWDEGKHGVVHVERAVYKKRIGVPKNGKPRTVPLTKRAALALKRQLLLTQHLASEWIFCTLKDQAARPEKRIRAGTGYRIARRATPFVPKGSIRDRKSLQRPLERLSKALVWKAFGPHIFRHTFASHLVMKGVSLRTVQILLGHSTIKMTERYSSLAPKVTEDAVLVLDKKEGSNG